MSDKLTTEHVELLRLGVHGVVEKETLREGLLLLIRDWHRLTARNAALVEALEFYSYGVNWKSVAIIEDDGEIARTALERGDE